MKTAATTERAELRVAPHWAQGVNEDGRYDYQKGWVIEARVPKRVGDAIYTYQPQAFGIDETEKAEQVIERLCGARCNGFWATISIGANDGFDGEGEWMLTGASY